MEKPNLRVADELIVRLFAVAITAHRNNSLDDLIAMMDTEKDIYVTPAEAKALQCAPARAGAWK